MKTLFTLFAILFVLFIPVSNYAQQTTVDLKDLSSQARNEILDAKKLGTQVDPETWKQRAEIGKAIALAVKETAKELNTEVNSFIKTPAGMITVGLIAYKIAGHDILQVILGIPFWLFITGILAFILRYFYGSRRIVTKGEKGDIKVTYAKRYEWKSDDARTAGIVAITALWAISTLVFTILILG